jgi:hypothetical protein
VEYARRARISRLHARSTRPMGRASWMASSAGRPMARRAHGGYTGWSSQRRRVCIDWRRCGVTLSDVAGPGAHFHATSGPLPRASAVRADALDTASGRMRRYMRVRRGSAAAPCVRQLAGRSRSSASGTQASGAKLRPQVGAGRSHDTDARVVGAAAVTCRHPSTHLARMLSAFSSSRAAVARPAPHTRRPTTSTATPRVGACMRAAAPVAPTAAVRLCGARSAFARSSGAATLTAAAGRRTAVAPSRRTMQVRRPQQPPGGETHAGLVHTSALSYATVRCPCAAHCRCHR